MTEMRSGGGRKGERDDALHESDKKKKKKEDAKSIQSVEEKIDTNKYSPLY